MGVWLSKEKSGGVAGYKWEHDGDVVEVDHVLARQLLATRHAGFREVPKPSAEIEEVEEAPEVVEVVPAYSSRGVRGRRAAVVVAETEGQAVEE